jgi:hypothetical protein
LARLRRRNRAYAVIKEFPAASLKKLAHIELIYLKAARFMVNIGANRPITILLSRISLKLHTAAKSAALPPQLLLQIIRM